MRKDELLEEDDEVIVQNAMDDADESDDIDEDDEDIDATTLTLESLKKNNELLARRLQAQEQVVWQQKIDDFKRQYNHVTEELRRCEEVVAKGVAEADGESVTRALKYRDECINKKREMEYEYANFESQTKAQEEAIIQAQANKERYAKNFAREVGWEKLSPEAQQEIMELDNRLAMVHDSTQREYFSMLKKKAQSIVARDRNAREKRADGAQKPRREIVISRERKEALIQAGVWDDPKLRVKYAKKYEEWDKENKYA